MVVGRVKLELDDAGRRTFAVRVHKVERYEKYVTYSGIPTVEYGLNKGSTCRGVGGTQVGIILLSLFWRRSQFTLLFPLTQFTLPWSLMMMTLLWNLDTRKRRIQMMLRGVLKVIQYSVLKLCGGGWEGDRLARWDINIGRHFLMSICYMPGTVLGTGTKMINKTQSSCTHISKARGNGACCFWYMAWDERRKILNRLQQAVKGSWEHSATIIQALS